MKEAAYFDGEEWTVTEAIVELKDGKPKVTKFSCNRDGNFCTYIFSNDTAKGGYSLYAGTENGSVFINEEINWVFEGYFENLHYGCKPFELALDPSKHTAK